jgi:hypothetical protein
MGIYHTLLEMIEDRSWQYFQDFHGGLQMRKSGFEIEHF